MAATKAKDIRELSADERLKRLRDLKQESMNLRLQRSAGTLENSARFKQVRREIAQLSRDRETVKKGLLWYTQRINTLREELSLLEEE
jgi:large subunit ribosomal protein L29